MGRPMAGGANPLILLGVNSALRRRRSACLALGLRPLAFFSTPWLLRGDSIVTVGVKYLFIAKLSARLFV